VNTEKDLWSCLSQSCIAERGGKKGGDVLDFLALMERCTVVEAAKRIIEWYGTRPPRAEKKPEADAPSPCENPALSFRLKGIEYHPYLEKRGIDKTTAATFGVGYFPGKGSMENRIVFPVWNPAGELVAYCGRAVNGEEPRYKFPSGFLKSKTLYNWHRIAGDTIIVVEGFFPCLWLAQNGYPAVSLMGSMMSLDQEELLAKKKVILFLDGDEPGQAASASISKQLMKKTFVRVVNVPGKQPDDL
jgi:DNA primase